MTRPTYTVIWDEGLDEEVAAVWQRANLEVRRELTRACNEIDRQLASAPDSVGRPWPSEPGSLLWSLPNDSLAIGVVYTIDRDDRIVKVSRIHLMKR